MFLDGRADDWNFVPCFWPAAGGRRCQERGPPARKNDKRTAEDANKRRFHIAMPSDSGVVGRATNTARPVCLGTASPQGNTVRHSLYCHIIGVGNLAFQPGEETILNLANVAAGGGGFTTHVRARPDAEVGWSHWRTASDSVGDGAEWGDEPSIGKLFRRGLAAAACW